MARPNWYLDWQGETCAIIASGPSTKRVKIDLLRERMRVIAIKENSKLAPWAECVYGCDAAWWRNENGLPNYEGLRVSVTGALTTRFRDAIKIARIIPHNDHLLLEEKDMGTLGSGGNSGFQALNLALQFGAKRVLLIGFDMSDEFGVHWYGRNQGNGRSNPGSWNFGRWRKAFDTAASQLRGTGIEVLLASDLSSLKCFPKVTVEQALERWK